MESCRAPDNVNVAVVDLASCHSPLQRLHLAVLNVCVNTFIPGKISVGGQVHSYVCRWPSLPGQQQNLVTQSLVSGSCM